MLFTFSYLLRVKALALSVTNKRQSLDTTLLAFWSLLCVRLFCFVLFCFDVDDVQRTIQYILTYVHDAMPLSHRVIFIKNYICVSLGFFIRTSLIYAFNFILAPRSMFIVLACFIESNVWTRTRNWNGRRKEEVRQRTRNVNGKEDACKQAKYKTEWMEPNGGGQNQDKKCEWNGIESVIFFFFWNEIEKRQRYFVRVRQVDGACSKSYVNVYTIWKLKSRETEPHI